MNTKTLHAKIREGLEILTHLANTHREHGRIQFAEDIEELAENIVEALRLRENTQKALRISARAERAGINGNKRKLGL